MEMLNEFCLSDGLNFPSNLQEPQTKQNCKPPVWTLMKEKILKTNELILESTNISNLNEQLKKEISTLKSENQETKKKYNIQLEKTTQLELNKEQYEKTLKEYKATIEKQQTKLNENDKHIVQLKCKIKNEEDKNRNLQQIIDSPKPKVTKKKSKPTKNQECQTIGGKKQDSSVNTEPIELCPVKPQTRDFSGSVNFLNRSSKKPQMKDFSGNVNFLKCSPKKPQMKTASINTNPAHISSVKPLVKDFTANVNFTSRVPQKPLMVDKNECTDECKTISQEPFPTFCSKCKSHISPAPVDQILKIMTTPPPVPITSVQSPPSSPKFRVPKIKPVNMQHESKKNVKKIPFLPVNNLYASHMKKVDKQECSAITEVEILTKKMVKLEKSLKKIKRKCKSDDSSNQNCCSKNIQFFVQYPDQQNRKKSKDQKLKPLKRLNQKVIRSKKNDRLVANKWQVESCSEPKRLKVLHPKNKMPSIKKLTSQNRIARLFESPAHTPRVNNSSILYSPEEYSSSSNLSSPSLDNEDESNNSLGKSLNGIEISNSVLSETEVLTPPTSQISLYKYTYPNNIEKEVDFEENVIPEEKSYSCESEDFSSKEYSEKSEQQESTNGQSIGESNSIVLLPSNQNNSITNLVKQNSVENKGVEDSNKDSTSLDGPPDFKKINYLDDENIYKNNIHKQNATEKYVINEKAKDDSFSDILSYPIIFENSEVINKNLDVSNVEIKEKNALIKKSSSVTVNDTVSPNTNEVVHSVQNETIEDIQMDEDTNDNTCSGKKIVDVKILPHQVFNPSPSCKVNHEVPQNINELVISEQNDTLNKTTEDIQMNEHTNNYTSMDEKIIGPEILPQEVIHSLSGCEVKDKLSQDTKDLLNNDPKHELEDESTANILEKESTNPVACVDKQITDSELLPKQAIHTLSVCKVNDTIPQSTKDLVKNILNDILKNELTEYISTKNLESDTCVDNEIIDSKLLSEETAPTSPVHKVNDTASESTRDLGNNFLNDALQNESIEHIPASEATNDVTSVDNQIIDPAISSEEAVHASPFSNVPDVVSQNDKNGELNNELIKDSFNENTYDDGCLNKLADAKILLKETVGGLPVEVDNTISQNTDDIEHVVPNVQLNNELIENIKTNEHANDNNIVDEQVDATILPEEAVHAVLLPVLSNTSLSQSLEDIKSNDSVLPSTPISSDIPITPKKAFTTPECSKSFQPETLLTEHSIAENKKDVSTDDTDISRSIGDNLCLTQSKKSPNDEEDICAPEKSTAARISQYPSKKISNTPRIPYLMPEPRTRVRIRGKKIEIAKPENIDWDGDFSQHLGTSEFSLINTPCVSDSNNDLEKNLNNQQSCKLKNISRNKSNLEVFVIPENAFDKSLIKDKIKIKMKPVSKQNESVNENSGNTVDNSSALTKTPRDDEEVMKENDLSFEELDFKIHSLTMATIKVEERDSMTPYPWNDMGDNNFVNDEESHLIPIETSRPEKMVEKSICEVEASSPVKENEKVSAVLTPSDISNTNLYLVEDDDSPEKEFDEPPESDSTKFSLPKEMKAEQVDEISEESSESRISSSSSSGIKRKNPSKAVQQDESSDEISCKGPVKRGRKKISDGVASKPKTTSKMMLLAKIKRLKKTSKAPPNAPNIRSEPLLMKIITEPAEPITDPDEISNETDISNKSPKSRIKSNSGAESALTSQLDDSVSEIVPAKKQRIAHRPKNHNAGSQPIEPKNRWSKKITTSKNTKDTSSEEVNEVDKFSTLLEDYEKTCKERAELSRLQRQRNSINPFNTRSCAHSFKSGSNSVSPPSNSSSIGTNNIKIEPSSDENFNDNMNVMDFSANDSADRNISSVSNTIQSPESNNQSTIQSANDISTPTSQRTPLVTPLRGLRRRQEVTPLKTLNLNAKKSTKNFTKQLKNRNNVPYIIDETNSSLGDTSIVSVLNETVFVSKNFSPWSRKQLDSAKKSEKFIYEQLTTLMETNPWTIETMEQVLNQLTGSKDSRTLALYIVEYATKKIDDFAEDFIREFTPPALLMKMSEQKIVVLVCKIDKKDPGFVDEILQGIQFKLFNRDKFYISDDVSKRLFRILIALNKIRQNRESVRIAICDAIYCLNLLALDLIDTALSSWSELIPAYSTENDIITKTIVHIIMTYKPNKYYPMLKRVRQWLTTDQHGYPKDGYQDENLITELLTGLKNNTQGFHTAVLLICKMRDETKFLDKIVNGIKNILLSQSDRSSTYRELTLLGNICRSLNPENISDTVSKTIDQLCDVLSNNDGSDDLKDGIVSCLSSITKFKYEKIAWTLMTWPSKKELRPDMRTKLIAFFNEHDFNWWWNFVKKKFPLALKV